MLVNKADEIRWVKYVILLNNPKNITKTLTNTYKGNNVKYRLKW